MRQPTDIVVALVVLVALLVSSLPAAAQDDPGSEILLDPDRSFPPEKLTLRDLSPQLEVAGPGSAVLVPLDRLEVTDFPADPTSQQEEGPPGDTLDELQDRMAAGNWAGTMALQGTADLGGDGGPLRFTSDFAGTVEIFVEDGTATGSYEMAGPMSLNALRPEGGFTADLSVQASGPVVGSDQDVDFDGAVETSGSATMYVTGVTEQSLAVPTQVIEVSWPVEMVPFDCSVTYGNFVASFSATVAQAGFSPNFTGYLTLFQDREEVRANINEWMAEMRTALEEGNTNLDGLEVPAALPEVVRLFSRLFSSFNAWTDEVNAGNYDFQRLIDLMHDADYLLIQLRNLDSCSAQLLGGHVDYFRTLTQTAVFQLVDGFSREDATAEQFQLVTFAALNAGLLNRVVPPGLTGAPQNLSDAASRIVNANTCGGNIYVVPEVYSTVATAAQMGWQLDLLDGPHSAAGLLRLLDLILGPNEPELTVEGAQELAACHAASGGES